MTISILAVPGSAKYGFMFLAVFKYDGPNVGGSRYCKMEYDVPKCCDDTFLAVLEYDDFAFGGFRYCTIWRKGFAIIYRAVIYSQYSKMTVAVMVRSVSAKYGGVFSH